MQESRFPAKRTPLKVNKAKTFAPIDPAKLYVAGVAAALGLTESTVRMRVHREQWELIPKPEPTMEPAPGGGKYFWYADKVAAFKARA